MSRFNASIIFGSGAKANLVQEGFTQKFGKGKPILSTLTNMFRQLHVGNEKFGKVVLKTYLKKIAKFQGCLMSISPEKQTSAG